MSDELVGALTNVLSNASNFPEKAQPYLLGQDMEPLRTRVVDAILPIIARERAAAKAEQQEADALIAERDYMPKGFGPGALNEGSRSQWYARGRDQAAAAIRAEGALGEGETSFVGRDRELLVDAVELVVTTQFGSMSMIQRWLRVGLVRACQIMDELERLKVVAPPVGQFRSRAVLVSPGWRLPELGDPHADQ